MKLHFKPKQEMDPRLFEAALTGNNHLLHQLLEENPLILYETSLFSTENPLHIASIAGQVDFVKVLLRLKPEFGYEFDQHGFSPLHMAAAMGKVDVVREIMGVDPKLCRAKGRDERTPLHVAAVKGKVGVVREMILSYVECAEDVNVQGETVLHLAVKNHQFEVLREIVKLLREMKKEHVLNMKDEQGNTVLHLATWRKQRQVIELILAGVADRSGLKIEVNAVNNSGLTALDLLQIFPSEAGDREIHEILVEFGAKRAISSDTASHPTVQSTNRTEQVGNLLDEFKFKRGRDSIGEARGALLVVASLVAIATFQAGLTPPGGTWQDNSVPTRENNTSYIGKTHLAGWSIMGTLDGVSFTLFVLFNSIGFAVSLSMINILTCQFPLQFELQVCMIAMYFSYNASMTTIAPSNVKLYCILITSIVPSAAPFLTRLLERPTYWLIGLVKRAIREVFCA